MAETKREEEPGRSGSGVEQRLGPGNSAASMAPRSRAYGRARRTSWNRCVSPSINVSR
jgi:hypothetical protein